MHAVVHGRLHKSMHAKANMSTKYTCDRTDRKCVLVLRPKRKSSNNYGNLI